MNRYWEEELYNGNIKFYLSYVSQFKDYRTEKTIEVDYSYIDSMREFLDDFSFEKVEE